MKKLVILLVALTVGLSSLLTACGSNSSSSSSSSSNWWKDYLYEQEDYDIVWDVIGSKVTIDMVTEKRGIAYATVDGKEYELGLDFLSMAMVYSTQPVAGSEEFATSEDVYAEWFRLYVQRWNDLLPEIPLYSNEYFDVYNTKIENLQTNPYWLAASALIDCTIKEGQESKVILGSVTELSGSFRNPALGVSAVNSADRDIETLSSGYATLVADKNGEYVWDDTVVKNHSEKVNEDGSKTFTIEIVEGLKYSDGSPVTAQDYLSYLLVFSSNVGGASVNADTAGNTLVGYEEYLKGGANTPFEGIRLLGDYEFSLTVKAQYIPYFYDSVYAAVQPYYSEMWLGEFEIKDDGQGAYIEEGFFNKSGEDYTMKSHLTEARFDVTTYPYSGAWKVESFNKSTTQAVLVKNEHYAGNKDGEVAKIDKVVYTKYVSATAIDSLKNGEIDILAGVTGATDTNSALALVESSNGKFAQISYDRAGYGKLQFRNDFGPAMFKEVRQAIAYSIDRDDFTRTFTGGYGKVVHGPYYEGSWMYQDKKEQLSENLNQYATSKDSAIAVLEAGGWVYDVNGNEYSTGVRYKKLTGSELIEENLLYHSKDNKYKTVLVDGEVYMPLVINWFCTVDNDVSELLKTSWANSEVTKQIGMVVQYEQSDFVPMMGEFYQYEGYGYNGDAVYSAFNLATGFTSAIYDYSLNWTVDSALYDNYSLSYLKDSADMLFS